MLPCIVLPNTNSIRSALEIIDEPHSIKLYHLMIESNTNIARLNHFVL